MILSNLAQHFFVVFWSLYGFLLFESIFLINEMSLYFQDVDILFSKPNNFLYQKKVCYKLQTHLSSSMIL
jgi:hypothetical protein